MQRSLQLADRLPSVTVKTAGLHPLFYRKRIDWAERDVGVGDVVEVFDQDGQAAGFGLYNPKSELALRMLSRGEERPDEAWWQKTLAQAVQLRREILKLDESTDAYRLVHAEGDGLSGLMVD